MEVADETHLKHCMYCRKKIKNPVLYEEYMFCSEKCKHAFLKEKICKK
ncbi:hypothetical protein KY345_03520 [Candidatus Woesearchaeota archaeon]|nr:hypothetical protein [Candidatus Woesearchaeota archaeon]